MGTQLFASDGSWKEKISLKKLNRPTWVFKGETALLQMTPHKIPWGYFVQFRRLVSLCQLLQKILKLRQNLGTLAFLCLNRFLTSPERLRPAPCEIAVISFQRFKCPGNFKHLQACCTSKFKRASDSLSPLSILLTAFRLRRVQRALWSFVSSSSLGQGNFCPQI